MSLPRYCLRCLAGTLERWSREPQSATAGMAGHRFCGVADHYGDGPLPELALVRGLTYAVESYLPGLARSVQDGIYEQAARNWMAVADLSLTRSGDAARASLVIGTVAIDGPGWILGQCEVGPWAGRRLRMTLDASDAFVEDAGVQRGIGLEEVVTHELGHFLGLGHSQGLMAPTYRPGLRTPQPVDDIPRIQAIWGPPKQIPAPRPPPTPTDRVVSIRVEGLPPGFTARLLPLGEAG